MLRSLTTDIPLLLKREASGERLTHSSFSKTQFLFILQFHTTLSEHWDDPGFRSLLFDCSSNHSSTKSTLLEFLGGRFRNSSPGFFELVMRYKLAKRDKKQQNCFISIWLCHKNTALTIGTAEVYFFVRRDPLWPCRPTSWASGTPLGLALEPLGPCRPTPWQPLPTLIVKSCFGNAQIDGTTPRMVPP